VRPDGTVRFVRARGFPIRDGAGNVYRVAGIAEDITENKRIEDELREGERRFRGVLANVEMTSLMLDRDGRVTYCNDYLLRLLGFRGGDVLGRDWLDFCVPGETGPLKKVFADLLADQRSAWHHENAIVARSGERRLIQWSNSVLRSPAGEVVGVASLGKDITEGKRAEDEVRRLNADLERRVSERTAELEAANRELEAFDYSISHDLRAPLSRIEGFGAALLEDFGDKLGPEGKDFVERIASAGQQMSRLVDDLLKLSTVTRGDLHRTRVDVSALARSVFDALHRAEPQRDVELLLPPGLTARADGGLLRIVLENLVGNAWKFTSRRTGAQVEVGSSCSRSGKQVLFVRDNGAGFDRANAQNLFAPFRRLHAQGQFQGSGIGLATVQRIVRRHGGHIWARSVVDEGAIFKFTLSP
jgi:PAS domain S-box-containing protein